MFKSLCEHKNLYVSWGKSQEWNGWVTRSSYVQLFEELPGHFQMTVPFMFLLGVDILPIRLPFFLKLTPEVNELLLSQEEDTKDSQRQAEKSGSL